MSQETEIRTSYFAFANLCVNVCFKLELEWMVTTCQNIPYLMPYKSSIQIKSKFKHYHMNG